MTALSSQQRAEQIRRRPATVRYVPSLLDRGGERRALRGLSQAAWAGTVPLIRVAPANNNERRVRNDTVKAWATHLSIALDGHAVFLDPQGLEGEGTYGHLPLAIALDTCRAAGVDFIPVHTLGNRQTLLATRVAAPEAKGVALRILPTQVALAGATSLPDAITRELNRLDVDRRSIDLLLDLGWLDSARPISAADIAILLDTVLIDGDWKSMTMLATTVPPTLKDFPEGLLSGFRRQEFELWSELRHLGFADLDFGDHGIQNPKPPDMRNARYMRASIRHTVDGATLIARGVGAILDLPVRDRFAQYRELSRLLFQHPQFAATSCCEADELIQACADGKRNIQAQQHWRGLSTLHHVTVVSKQLSASTMVAPAEGPEERQPVVVSRP